MMLPMSPPRASVQALGRLLDAAAQGVVVFDDELRVVVCNQVAAELCGHSVEELIGQSCRYHSGAPAGTLEAATAALCPPPEVLAGKPLRTVIVLPSAEGSQHRLLAEYLPLTDSVAGPIAVIAWFTPETERAEEQLGGAPSSAGTRALHDEVAALQRAWRGPFRSAHVLGTSPVMRRVQAQAAVAATCDADLLLIGSPGSGRAHLARVIHYARSEAAAPLLDVSAPLATVETLQDVLRIVARPPVGSSARPTLLISDIEQLSNDGQFVLSEALRSESRTFRAMATTSRELIEPASPGQFRVELAHLLSTIVIGLPNLVSRREDVPWLSQALLEELNASHSKQVGGFTPEAIEALQRYPWPGNLAELREVLRQAHSAAEGPHVRIADLPSFVRLGAAVTARPRKAKETIVLGEFLEQIEREVIGRALSQARGNKARAARLLGITRPRLYRRMLQLKIVEAHGTEPPPS